MPMTDAHRQRRSWLAANGALCAAAAVALSAYAAHAAQGPAQARLQTAALFAFGHGVALAVLAPQSTRTLARLALAVLYAWEVHDAARLWALPDMPLPDDMRVYDWASVANGTMSTVIEGLFVEPSDETVGSIAELREDQIEARTADVLGPYSEAELDAAVRVMRSLVEILDSLGR